MSSFAPAGSGGVPIVANIPGVVSPTVANVTVPLAATEYSYALPGDTKRFLLKLRDSVADLKLAYSVGTSGTTYITIHRGTWYEESDIDTSATITLYFQTTSGSQVLEIVSWT